MSRCLIILMAGVVLSGCARFAAVDRDARATALAVHKQTVKLKQAVRLKVEAEERYYRGAVEIADQARQLAEFTEISRGLIARAEALAAELQRNPQLALAERLRKDAQESVKALDAAVAARREQREAMRQNLQALRDLQNEYDTLEQTLVRLSTPADQRENLGALLNFIQQTAEHYRQLDQAQRKAEKGTP